MQKLFLLWISIFLFKSSYSQDSLILYKSLPVVKTYAVLLESEENGTTGKYWANKKLIDKKTYDKYYAANKILQSGKPGHFRCYDLDGHLLSDYIGAGEYIAGWYNIYYPNGKLKEARRYKDNPAGIWKYPEANKYCNIPSGKWTYYKPTGEVFYSEYWDNGQFIKQVPTQDSNEVWKLTVTLNGQTIRGYMMTGVDGKNDSDIAIKGADLKKLLITPYFKNNAVKGTTLSLKLQLTCVGKKQFDKSYNSIDDFKKLDVNALLAEAGMTSADKPYFTLTILADNIPIYIYGLNVKL